MKKGQKTPDMVNVPRHKTYFESSASMDELSEIHGVLGSNTLPYRAKKSTQKTI